MQVDARPGVLLVGNYPPPFGGIPTHLEQLAPHLAERGADVHVLAPKYKSIPEPNPSEHVWLHAMEPRSTVAKIGEVSRLASALPVFRGRPLDLRQTYYTLHLADQIGRLIDGHGIRAVSAYHVLPAGLAAMLATRRRNVPCVVTVFGEVYSDPDLFTRKRRLTDFTLRRATATWSVSRHCAEGARRHGYPTDVTYFGVSPARFSGALSTEAPEVLRSIQGPAIGFVARMEEEMGLGVLLEAAPAILAERPDSAVLIAGRRGGLTSAAEGLAARQPGRVHVLADPSNQTVADVYAAATVVAVPSTNERACLGLAIAEASASGRPVVVSNVGGGPEILGPGAGSLVPPRDPQALADVLIAYLRDPGRCRAEGMAGRSFIQRHFSQDERNAEIAERLIGLAQDSPTS